jgi:hypothetical protein
MGHKFSLALYLKISSTSRPLKFSSMISSKSFMVSKFIFGSMVIFMKDVMCLFVLSFAFQCPVVPVKFVESFSFLH